MPGKSIDAIGVDDQRCCANAHKVTDELRRFLILRKSGTKSDYRFAFKSCSRRARAKIETVPSAVSSSSSVINSGADAATVLCTDLGDATVTSPAPVLRAASPAMAGAPLFPTEPPITNT